MEKSQNNYSHKNGYKKNKRYKRRYRNYRRARYNNGNNWNFNVGILSLDDIKTRKLLDDKAYQDYLKEQASQNERRWFIWVMQITN